MSTTKMITNWEIITPSFAKKLMKSGMIFTAVFTKLNGESRTLNGRANVKKHIKGTGRPNTNPDCIIVWECNKSQYRTIDVTRLDYLKMFGHYLLISNE